MKELWLPVVGFEGLYEISSFGRVKSLRKNRMMKPQNDKNGYKQVCLWKDRKHHTKKIHRLVLSAFFGPCPGGMECCHSDNDKSNNRIDNLRWDTHRTNQVVDGGARGIIGKGQDNPMATLTEGIVLSIRRSYSENPRPHREVAADFGISRRLATRIIGRERWKHI